MATDLRISPYTEDPRYWQYEGKPMLLLGGSREDNLFQIPDIEPHLDLLHSVGGNYVRCTMSSRDEGDVWPFDRDPATGLYDLEQPGTEYWGRFSRFLELARERGVIAQIELWDRFDFAREPWQLNPYNPKNNINYTTEQTGMQHAYHKHPGAQENPFFRSLPSMENIEILLHYQRLQVEKMLSISLDYPNVLYCMNNETGEPHAWGQYWIEMIQAAAAARGVSVYTTDMFDDGFKAEDSKTYPEVFADTRHYSFIDVSQINSRNFHEPHWQRMRWMVTQAGIHPRPANCVKIYGSGHKMFGTGSPKDGVERFWRNILAGCASVRFHRPDSGNGLNERAQASIRAARLLEAAVKPWTWQPQMERIVDRPCEAYLVGTDDHTYVVYFADGGQIAVDLADSGGRFAVRWLSVADGTWHSDQTVDGSAATGLSAPADGDWVAVLAPQP